MFQRFLRAVAVAASLALVFACAAPATAATNASQRAQLVSRMRQLKRNLLLAKQQKHLQIARAYAYYAKHHKFPRGFKLEHPKKEPDGAGGEGAAGEIVRVQRSAAEAAAIVTNRRANNPAGDTPPNGGNGFQGATQSETSIAANGNNVLVTWNDGEGFNINTSPGYQLLGYGYSTDGGTTWTDGGGLPVPPGFPGWQWSSDPTLTVNESNGEFWFAGLVNTDGPPPPDGSGTRNGIAVVKGTFSGGVFTWGVPKLAFDGSNTTNGYDKQWIAVDPANGNLYLSYTNFVVGGDMIEFRRSTDSGATWSAAQTVSDLANDFGYVQGSRVAVGVNGEVYVVWQTIGEVDADYFEFRKSTNNGVSFAGFPEVKAVQLYANIGTGAPGFNRVKGVTYPSMAVDRTNGPHRGRVYLTWNESVNWYAEYYNTLTSGAVAEPEAVNGTGVNDTPANATAFTPGNKVRGWIGVAPTSGSGGDIDFFKFNATQGTTYLFAVDSIAAGLNMAFRVICTDGTTRLAFSAPGAGFGNLIVWTAPTTAQYYMRPASLGGSGYYAIRTLVHVPNPPPEPGSPDERGRDARDIFTCYSNDGYTNWSTPVLVNDDPPYYDNWLPEIAVAGSSRVFTAWFDFRDAPAGKCGGLSGFYASRSDDGTTWSSLGPVADALSNWTTATSNVSPNQGDYVSLYANANGLYPAWGDARDGDPNVYTVQLPLTATAAASLLSHTEAPNNVDLIWLATDYVGQTATLQRREGSAAFADLGTAVVDNSGHVHFVDTTAEEGVAYVYRLSFGSGSTLAYSSEATIIVPATNVLSLLGVRPNPATGAQLTVSLVLPSRGAATLSLVDLTGRRVRFQRLDAFSAGPHLVDLSQGTSVRPGIYMVVLQLGERVISKRVSVIR